MLLILADLADYLVVEVLDDVEVVEHGLNPGILFLEGFLEIRVHITGHGLYGSHSLKVHMLDEFIDHLLENQRICPDIFHNCNLKNVVKLTFST